MVEIGAPSTACSAAASRARAASSRIQAGSPARRRRAWRRSLRDERADPLRQLGGRAIGERHDQDLVEAGVAAEQAIDDQVLERKVLPVPAEASMTAERSRGIASSSAGKVDVAAHGASPGAHRSSG